MFTEIRIARLFLELRKIQSRTCTFDATERLNRVSKASALNGKDDAVWLWSAM